MSLRVPQDRLLLGFTAKFGRLNIGMVIARGFEMVPEPIETQVDIQFKIYSTKNWIIKKEPTGSLFIGMYINLCNICLSILHVIDIPYHHRIHRYTLGYL